MINAIALVMVAIVSVSCGKSYDVPNEFQKYVDRFADGARAHNRVIDLESLSIEFSDLKFLGEDKSGLCYMAYRSVQIDREFWDAFSDLERELLIKHELGHCLLGRRHRDDLLFGGPWAASIMHPSGIAVDWYLLRKDYYENELYNTVE